MGQEVQPPLVLIIEDDDSLRDAVKSSVRLLGYSPLAFDSVESFHKAVLGGISTIGLHAVIADQNLPGMTGLSFLEKHFQSKSTLQKILITAMPDIDVEMLSKNGIKLLNKPLDLGGLEVCLRNA